MSIENLLKEGEVIAIYSFGERKKDYSLEEINEVLQNDNKPPLKNFRIIEGFWIEDNQSLQLDQNQVGMPLRTIVGTPAENKN